MSARRLDDHVNRDAAKNIRASAAEEAVLGIMLMQEDKRHYVASGDAGLTADDFSTEFGRRLFEALCELENSEYGFSKAVLGQMFDLDEMGKIEQIEQQRRKLSRNDQDVLDDCIRTLREEKEKNAENVSTADLLANMRKRAQQDKDKKNNS